MDVLSLVRRTDRGVGRFYIRNVLGVAPYVNALNFLSLRRAARILHARSAATQTWYSASAEPMEVAMKSDGEDWLDPNKDRGKIFRERLTALTEVQRIEFERRYDACRGVKESSLPLFWEHASLQRDIDAYTERYGLRMLKYLGAGAVGFALYWNFQNESKGSLHTLGIGIMAITALVFCMQWWDHVRRRNRIADLNRDLFLLLSTWIGAGADASAFWHYGRLIDATTGKIDDSSARYQDWWFAVQETLLRALNRGGYSTLRSGEIIVEPILE